jgi:NitT/TauT family transport system substrate-binding protein
VLRSFTALFVFCATLASAPMPVFAQEQVRIGIGFGLAFLPLYICEDLKLVEKHAKTAHLDVRASFRRFMAAGELQAAIASGDIDIGPFGTAPLLTAWQKAKDTPGQMIAVSGITSLPLVLLSNQANVQSFADLKSESHIAVPTLTSPQTYLLELQTERPFARYDRIRDQLVVLSHADAMAALIDGSGQVAAYFSSPPYTELALRDANVHAILGSTDVMKGKFSFLILGATKAYVDAQPQIAEAIKNAVDEAARIIHDDPRRAAQIYLTHEPSATINGGAMEAVVRDIKDEFGSTLYGVQSMADFMGRHGELKSPPRSWKDIVAPALLNSPST